MSRRQGFGTVIILIAASACVRAGAAHAPRNLVLPAVNITADRAFDSYTPIPPEAATILGCGSAPKMPVCEVARPSPEEDSAFKAEAARLRDHHDGRCRQLGGAIDANREHLRMYRKALVRDSENGRLYGVGHTYALDDEWMVRVARRIDDLNERSMEEKKRTLRHEMSHTLGAKESREGDWSAEDYALHCG